jgi:small ligand-binding sensory domain FIST
LSHAGGFVLSLPLLAHIRVLRGRAETSVARGRAGGTALAIFSHSRQWRQGIIARSLPGAAIPAAFAMVTQGCRVHCPRGFSFIGIWLIS